MAAATRTLRTTGLDLVAPSKDAVSPEVSWLFFGTSAAVVFVLSFVTELPLERISFLSMGFLFLCIAAYAVAFTQAPHPGMMRIEDRATLRWVPKISIALVWPPIIAIIGMMPGAFALVGPLFLGERFGGGWNYWGFIVVSLFFTVWLVQYLWRLRGPTGLSASPMGLSVLGEFRRVLVAWDDLVEANVSSGKNGIVLRLWSTKYGVTNIAAGSIGSDPNIVAAIIEYFRTHPEDRHYLASSGEAIRMFESRNS